MKHFNTFRFTLLCTLALLLSTNSFSQITSYPWLEDFGSGSCNLPAGFTNSGSDPWDFQNISEEYMEGTDHTSGTGCFASMDDSGTNGVDDTCVLVTPAFNLTGLTDPRCSFWWQNSNSTTSNPAASGPRPWSNLEVDISTDSGMTWTPSVFTIIDSQQIGWAYAEFSLGAYISAKTMIRFRGIETQYFQSDFSLDDIRVYNVPAFDAEVTEALGIFGVCPGTANLSASITNLGSTVLTSANINWSVNGVVQTPVAYTGSLGYTEGDTVLLGSYPVASGVNYDIAIWLSNQNTTGDNNAANDTLFVNDAITGLNGAYSIGAAGDFVNMVDAVNALNTYGVCGPVNFTVNPGTYTGKLAFREISGASATNTVSFFGINATITDTTDAAARYIVLLDGTDYLRLDSFAIVGGSADYGYGILLMNEANYNTINACHIDLTAVTSTTAANSAGIVASSSLFSTTDAGNNANYCKFTNNFIEGGSTGLYYGIRLNGNTGGLDCAHNLIENNNISDVYAYNIYLYNTDSAVVRLNDISRANKTGVTTFYGVYLTGGLDNLIERNRIHNTHDVASSLTGASYPIYFSAADAPVGQPNVAYNNLIYNINSNGTIYGMYNSSSDGAYFLHNTVSLDHTAATAGTTRGYYQTTTASDVVVVNNIFSITRGGSGEKHGLYYNSTGSTITSDNNIVYVNSAGTGDQFYGYWSSTDYDTFAGWQTANSNGFDQASDSANPQFADIALNDFTPGTVSGNNIGFPVPEIPEDFFFNPRDPLTPDPGAIEFIAVPENDSCHNAIHITAGVYNGTTFDATTDNEISCVVGNDPEGGVWYTYTGTGDYATVSLCGSQFDTRVRVYSGTCGSLICETGNEDSCATQSVAGWCTENATDYYILVYGNGETGRFDLELTETPVTPATITALTDTVFCAGDSAILEANEGQMYSWNDINETSTRTITLLVTDTLMVSVADTNGCWSVSAPQIVTSNPLPEVDLGVDTTICDNATITLDAGAGSSYNWSTGASSQTITYDGSNGNTTISVEVTDGNGCVGTDEINIDVDICSGIEERGNTAFSFYPNPNNGQFILTFKESSNNKLSMNVYDIQGKTVFSEQFYMNSNRTSQIDLGELPKGFYTVIVQDNNNVHTEKLIIK